MGVLKGLSQASLPDHSGPDFEIMSNGLQEANALTAATDDTYRPILTK